MVFHVKVKDNAVGKHVGKVSHQAERSQVVEGTEVGEESQRNKQGEEIDSATALESSIV